MLTCHACRRICLKALVRDTLGSIISPHTARIAAPAARYTINSSPWAQRRYATQDVVTTERKTRLLEKPGLKIHDGEAKGRITMYPKAELEKELLYLPDPLKLANNTLNLLRQDDHVKALEVVRYASNKMSCTVSWNHIIDYNMSKGRVTPAIKTYNEMKKRAQPPDAYTYTILLRGLAHNSCYPQSLPRALRIYNSMYAANAPVRPSIIHINAALKVCSRSKDMDALFQVAAKLPTRGKSAPDNMTFTTVINALRNATLDSAAGMSTEKVAKRKREAVLQGCRMWEDIIGRWRDGEILMDEDMVCAMGRLLILGDTPQDYDDVLSIVEQTMGITRLLPPIADPARQTHLNSKSSASLVLPDPSAESKDAEASNASQKPLSISEETPTNPTAPTPSSPSIFTPLPLTPSSLPRSFARPSYQTLSILIDACTHMSAIPTANAYWALLTGPPHSIIPDAENLHMYLRLLRLSRSSRLALTLLQDMVRPRSSAGLGIPPQPKSFRIVMSTVVRDGKNRHAVDYATQVLKLMTQHLEDPDLRTCEMFVGVLEKFVGDSRLGPHSDPIGYREVLGGLSDLEPVVANLRSLLAYGSFQDSSPPALASLASPNTDSPDEDPDVPPDHSASRPHHNLPAQRTTAKDLTTTSGGKITAVARLQVRTLMQRMVGVYDRVLQSSREAMGAHDLKRALERRARLTAFVGREMARQREGKDWSRQRRVRVRAEHSGVRQPRVVREVEGEERGWGRKVDRETRGKEQRPTRRTQREKVGMGYGGSRGGSASSCQAGS